MKEFFGEVSLFPSTSRIHYLFCCHSHHLSCAHIHTFNRSDLNTAKKTENRLDRFLVVGCLLNWITFARQRLFVHTCQPTIVYIYSGRHIIRKIASAVCCSRIHRTYTCQNTVAATFIRPIYSGIRCDYEQK